MLPLLMALNNFVGLISYPHYIWHLLLSLWCDFKPLIPSHYREEAHVLPPNDPEQLRQSDLIPTLSGVPYINPVVSF